MKTQSSNHGPLTPTGVMLDGVSVSVPDWAGHSLGSIQAHLENLASCRGRVLWTLRVEGIEVERAPQGARPPRLGRVVASTIAVEDYCSHLVGLGVENVRAAEAMVEDAILRVVVNESPANRLFWQRLQILLREPLMQLDSLRELLESRMPAAVPAALLAGQAKEISSINSRVESLLLGQTRPEEDSSPGVELSEILEHRVQPWLAGLNECFISFYERSRG